MATESWVIVTRWDEFQHYAKRDPIWIKSYTRLLSDDRYLGLSFHLRGILHSIWLEYARASRQLPGSTLSLTRRLGHRVTTRDLTSLSDAGFIQIIASSPLAPRYQDASPEAEAEAEPKNKDLPTSKGVELPATTEGEGFETGGIDPDQDLTALMSRATPEDIPF